MRAQIVDVVPGEDRVHRWERRAEWPLVGLAVLFLAAYAVSVLHPGLTPAERSALDTVTVVVWALFAVDYVGRLVLARDRVAFVRQHWFDLLVLALPLLRQLRALKILTVLSSLEGRLRRSLRTTVTVYVVGATGLVGFVASLAVLDAERAHPDATITGFGDAVWWAMTTITTVGYGDRYPVTTEGRVVAAVLMVGGIALLGTVTATLASWFVERLRVSTAAAVAERDAEQRAETGREAELLRAVLDEVQGVSARLARMEDELRAR